MTHRTKALPFYSLFEERASTAKQSGQPKPPPPSPCEPQPKLNGLAACPWVGMCTAGRLECKAFKMYVAGSTPMSVIVLNRGYQRTPLEDNPQDDDDAIAQYPGSAAEAAAKKASAH